MPRLISKRPKHEVFLRATRDVPYSGNSPSAEFYIRRGEVVPATDYRVRGSGSDPEVWEELPPLEERDPAPGRDEPAAVAQANFVVDGRLVFQEARFWPDHPLVRRYPRAFVIQLP